MLFLKKFWVWVKKHWKLVLAVWGTLSLVLAMYFFKDDLKELEILKRKVDISKRKKEIIKLESQKEMISKDRKGSQEEIKRIDNRLEAIEKDVNKRRSEIAKITLNQRLEELDKMGY